MLTDAEMRILESHFPNSFIQQYAYGNLYEIKQKNLIIKIYKNFQLYNRELSCIKKLKECDFVPRIVQYQECGTFYFIAFVKETAVDLFDLISANIVNESLARHIAKQMLIILKKLQQYNIVHKDIKLENILYDKESKKVILIDFEGQFTLLCSAPECAEDITQASFQSDLWSLGITLYKLIARAEPFKTLDQVRYRSVSFTKNMSPEFRNFLSGLLMKNPEERFTVDEALNHSWILNNKKILTCPDINVTKNSQKEGTHTNI